MQAGRAVESGRGARTESLVDGDELPVTRVELEAGARPDALLEDEVVALGPLHKVPELQAGRPRAHDDVLGTHDGWRRRGRADRLELGREPGDQRALRTLVVAKQRVDGVQRLRRVAPEQRHQLRARLRARVVTVSAAPGEPERGLQLLRRELRRHDELLELRGDVLAVERRAVLRMHGVGESTAR